MAYCITKSMGMKRIKARVSEWQASLAAGFAAAPRRKAKTKAGEPCHGVRMRGSDLRSNLCLSRG